MKELRAWLRRWFVRGRSSYEREFSAEIDSHLDMHTADNLRAGMTPEEARRQALVALGGVEQAKERYRERGAADCRP